MLLKYDSLDWCSLKCRTSSFDILYGREEGNWFDAFFGCNVMMKSFVRSFCEKMEIYLEFFSENSKVHMRLQYNSPYHL